MSSRVSTIISAIAVVFLCAVIFTMSAMPADDSIELSMGVVWHIIGFIVPGYDQMSPAEQLHWQQLLDHPVRKVAHFSEYALLGLLSLNLVMRLRAFADKPRAKQVLVAWAFATAFSVTDEIHQIFVPGRSFLVTDICIDSAGALTGIGVLLLILAIVRAIRGRKQRQD